MARQVMDQIVKNGRVLRAWLGVRSQPVTPGIAKAFGLSGEPRGALVSDVLPKGPAAQAGMTTGDIILSMNGQAVPTNHDLRVRIAMMAPGTKVRVRVLRKGAERDVPVTLGEEPSEKKEHEQPPAPPSARDTLLKGIDVAELNSGLAEHLGVREGTKGVVVAHIDGAGEAADSGLKPGDVIEQVNHKQVADRAGFKQEVGSAGESPILLLVNRAGTAHFVLIEPD